MNLTGITNQVTAGDSATLAYSAANRLTSAVGPWGTKTHYYDGVGNRITDNTVLNGVTTSRTQYYSPTSNRLDNIWQNGALLQYYSHDGAGNMISLIRTGESFQYTYNKRNRLSSVTRNGAPWGTYVYNALEQLVSRSSNAPSVPAGTVHYLYDRDGHLIAEADAATGATLREYLWVSEGTMQRSGGPLPFTNANDNTSGSSNDTLAEDLGVAANDNEAVDLPLAVIDGINTATPTTSYIHTDHLGRPTRMTNAAKATVWSAVWTPWGEPQSISGSVTNNLRFPGQYFQIETGLAYNWHRHYDPVMGRYTQPDPLRFVDGPSIYAYAGNSPFMNTDREGRQAVIPIPGPRKPPIGFPIPGGGGQSRPFDCPRGAVVCPRPPSALEDFLDGLNDIGASIYGMCKRIFGSGGGRNSDDDDDCESQLSTEQFRCGKRISTTALPGMYRACMTRATARYAACRMGKEGPPSWSDADEEVWRNFDR